MVGAIAGAAIQAGSSIYGAIKSSQANKRAQDLIQSQKDENRKWYEQRMAEDYTQRADVQNVLRKQRDMLSEQYKRARATNIVAGGTDESLAMQQQAANEVLGDTMGNIAAQAEAYREGVENQYRAQDAALTQQQVAAHQQQAAQIAAAAGQAGKAVSGLVSGGLDASGKPAETAGQAGTVLGGTTTYDSYAEQDARNKVGQKPATLTI
jgi:hypothetical protein